MVDQVKIDRTFVAAAVRDPKQAQLLAGIITLAKDLGLSVVLEGIETSAELALGLANQCDLLQGFLLAKPMPPESAAELFDTIHPCLDSRLALPVHESA